MSEKKLNFTWVQTHKELVRYLETKNTSQEDLVSLLRNAGVTRLHDEEEKGQRIDLKEIDPFTFFCFINKYGPERRLAILQNIARQLKLTVPEDEFGLPSSQGQKVMLFSYSYRRNQEDITNLWHLFYEAVSHHIYEETFNAVLSQYGIGKVKITEVLFYVSPENYFPINKPTIPYLKEVLGIDPSFQFLYEYEDILKEISSKTDKPFYEISYDAWVWNEEQKKKDQKYTVFQELIDRYKQFLKEESIENERYKWQAIHHFQQKFNIDADDFTESLRSAVANAGNLIYVNSIGFIRKSVQYFPEEVRDMFRGLYNESQPLKDRFKAFVTSADELLPKVINKVGKKRNHQQDERTLSYYLTMRYPENYPLYKNETYQYLLSILGDKESRPAGEKFFHYMELAEDLIQIIESDGDVIDMVEEQLTEKCYQGEQKWLVFQDILWVNMRNISQTHYWVFQCNPEIFDLEKALKDGALSSWRVNTHKSKIIPGDKVILWATGRRRGCYGLAEVESEVIEDGVNENEILYYSQPFDEESFDQVQIRITHNLANNPITEEQIKSNEKLSGLNVGTRGTNFTATQEEYEALVDLAEGACDAKWNELVDVVYTISNEQAVRKFFATVRHVMNGFDLSINDEITYASAIKKYVQFTIGSRYVTHLERKKGKVFQGFYVDNSHLDELKTNYTSLKISDKAVPSEEGEMSWVYMEAKDVNIEDFFEGILALAKKGIEGQAKSQYRSTYSEKHNPWIAKVALNDNLLDKLLRGEKMSIGNGKQKVDYPLNTIFYGPPGTGKTYTTIKRAAETVKGRKFKNYKDAKEAFHNHLHEEIEFITFHQNYSYEDFIQGLRPDTENDKELTFDRVDGTFKKLADKALKNYEASKSPQTKKKPFEDVFNAYITPLVEGEVEELEVEMKRVSYYITAVTNRSIEFRKASGGTAHSLSISTLKRMYEAESVLEIQGLSSYYSPLLEVLLDMGKSPGETETVEKKNYVLIIDEINRANISRVFGELITLIEPDKRYGREMHIPAKLPSGESFSVPENLYIIGTMNTADKSIALLDIALRRRFEFEAMYPKYEINGEQIYDSDVLQKINERVKKLKGHDFQIGHSYFMKNHITLKQRMNRRVIPLLLEYFMNDEKEVRDILTHAGLSIEEGSWPLEITGRA